MRDHTHRHQHIASNTPLHKMHKIGSTSNGNYEGMDKANLRDMIDKTYAQFKRQLLIRMCDQDPLQILESQLFQVFESQLSSILDNLVSPKHSHQPMHNAIEMDSVIRQYKIDGIPINVVQKRSHSCHIQSRYSHCTNRSEQRQVTWSNKMKRMEQQSKVDLMIWSNIMYHHFRVNQQREYRTILEDKYLNTTCHSSNKIIGTIDYNTNHFANLKSNCNNNKQNSIQASNLSMSQSYVDMSKSVYQQQTHLQTTKPQTKSKNYINKMIDGIALQINLKPTPQNTKKILKRIFMQWQQDNQKTNILLNKLRAQNDRLHKNLQENSMKQLQYIVQIKQLQKLVQDKEEDINKLESRIRAKEDQSRDKEMEYSRNMRNKIREIQHLHEENTRKNYLQQLRQKLAIDSIRRTTLSTLNKQRLQIQLEKSQLGYPFGHQVNSTFLFNQADPSHEQSMGTQETRCDQ